MGDIDISTTGFVRPPNAAARIAALRDRFNASTRPTNPNGGYNTKTIDTINSCTAKWLIGLENLSNTLLERRKIGNDDKEASEERVHKIRPTQECQHHVSVVDIRMDEAPPVEIDVSSEEVNSHQALAKQGQDDKTMAAVTGHRIGAIPLSPPAKKFEGLEIQSSTLPTSFTEPAIINKQTLAEDSKQLHVNASRGASANNQAQKLHSLPPSPEVPSSEQTLAHIIPTEPVTRIHTLTKGIEGSDDCDETHISMTSSSKKKPRLSNSKTVLDVLMEKRSSNPIFYDGTTQKFFHNLVLEFSQQIQAIKREKRMVMFAKDPACMKLLELLDDSLQEALKMVENASYEWLKGRPDLKEVNSLRERLSKAQDSIQEFKKLDWTLNDGDETESEDDDVEEDGDIQDDGSENEGSKALKVE